MVVITLAKDEIRVAKIALAMVTLTMYWSGTPNPKSTKGITASMMKPVPIPVSPAINPPINPAITKSKFSSKRASLDFCLLIRG